jgi:hypothetical protein
VLEGLVTSQLGDRQQTLVYNGQAMTVGQFLDEAFGYQFDFIWWRARPPARPPARPRAH